MTASQNSYNFGKVNHFLFIGGTELLTMCLENLKTHHQITVATNPWQANEPSHIPGLNVIDYLKKNKIETHVFETLKDNNDFKKLVTAQTIGISISAPWIIKKAIIDLFDGKIINIHCSRLPQNRGGGGLSWQIMQGTNFGYGSWHFVTEGIDDGNILHFTEFPYPPLSQTPAALADYMRREVAKDFTILAKKIETNEVFHPRAQSEHLSTYWPRLNTDINGFLNWSWELKDMVSFIQAFSDPFKGAQTFIGDTVFRLKEAVAEYNDGSFHPFQIGIVYRKHNNALYIATKQGTLVIRQVNDNNGNSVFEQIALGERFFTPQKFLEEALMTRVQYNAHGLKKN